MITRTDLQQMREYEQKATRGEWGHAWSWGPTVNFMRSLYGGVAISREGKKKFAINAEGVAEDFSQATYDAEFIARARTDFPRLIDECEKLLAIAEVGEKYGLCSCSQHPCVSVEAYAAWKGEPK